MVVCTLKNKLQIFCVDFQSLVKSAAKKFTMTVRFCPRDILINNVGRQHQRLFSTRGQWIPNAVKTAGSKAFEVAAITCLGFDDSQVFV